MENVMISRGPESWRKLDIEEWGNSIGGTAYVECSHMMRVLHEDAAKVLPPETRYIILTSWELSSGNGGICWYRTAAMDADLTWGCGFGRREGYYLVGQYLTPGGK